ncbi:MAG TPA: GYF domain-containing protein [Polyangiaceae bacterium]
MDFWVTSCGAKPVGPVSEALVVQGIEAGMIPREALVCEVGGAAWQPIADIAPFAGAIARRRAKRGAETDRTIIDPYPMIPSEPPGALHKVDETVDRTVLDLEPPQPSDAPARRTLQRFDETEEKTVADAGPPATDPAR